MFDLEIELISFDIFCFVVTKTGNDHKPPQTATNNHKLPVSDHKLPQTTNIRLQTSNKRTLATSKRPQTATPAHRAKNVTPVITLAWSYKGVNY